LEENVRHIRQISRISKLRYLNIPDSITFREFFAEASVMNREAENA
jgi:hypothetical protein